MNRRGWLRIVEASIAVVIILSVLFTLYSKSSASNEPDLSIRAREVLDEIAINNTIRAATLANDVQGYALVNASIASRLSSDVLFEVRICDLTDVCGKSTYTPGNVYAAERIIGATLDQEQSKKIRLFIWRVQ